MSNETLSSASHALNIAVTKGSDINEFFALNTDQEFIDWFNTNCANKGFWLDKKRGDMKLGTSTGTRLRFNKIWEQFPIMFNAKKISLAQFICLQSIFINEVGAPLKPITEAVGIKNHPGLSYAFDNIAGLKQSYNQPPNKTAFALFNDDLYIGAHGHLAQADRLKKTLDLRWNSTVYPQGEFPVSTDPAETGFIREADFFKFRGRGFIQTTWRENYLRLIKYIQTYTGQNALILSYKNKWSGQKPDDVATTSTNDDWNDLFQNSDLVIPCAGISTHNNASGKYLSLSNDLNVFLGKGKGSIFNMGKRISGGDKYATLFQGRVIQIMMTLKEQL